MSKEFIAELHDIGKLVDKNKTELKAYSLSGHTFENFDFSKHNITKPTSPSWWGQFHHNIKASEYINNWQYIDSTYKPDVFLLIIADHLASSISRALPPLGSAGESEGVLKLWNDNFYENEKRKGKHLAAFAADDDLKKMFDTIDKISSPDEFLNTYCEHLLITPEDKSIPRNITSLYTHVELVGKIYRVLKKHCEIITDHNGTFLKLGGNEARSVSKAEGGNRTSGNQNVNKSQWQARFIKCHIKFPHSFVRLQDINLLVRQAELIKSFVTTYQDYVMFYTHNFISLFLPIGVDLKNIFKDFLNIGFFIDCVEMIADLGILRSNLDIKIIKAREANDQRTLTVLNNRDTKVYKKVLMPEDVSEEIPPHICDICQMQVAIERIKENIREWICDNCYGIRQEGNRFNYPEEWQDQKIVWLKFSLNHDKLENWMQEAFGRYIDSLNDLKDKQTLKDEFRSLACHSDFVKDYIEMVREFWKKCENLGIMKPILDYDEIGVCKYSGELVNKIIKELVAVHNDYFPDCDGDAHSPVSLSLSISHIKYPVREHWRYFENPKSFLNIRSHNVFEDTYTKEEIKWLMDKLSEAERESSHFLYKLIGLYGELNSEINITVEILNNKGKHPAIYNLYSKFETSPEKMLNFFRIIEETDEITKA
ncbi:MAG: hypothetical protein KG029_08195 [Bacteroidetes bacterium]|nr:hypothetical protein [Bacteroidota bacterium]